MEGNGKRGNKSDADLEEEAEPATEAPLRLVRMRTLPCGVWSQFRWKTNENTSGAEITAVCRLLFAALPFC